MKYYSELTGELFNTIEELETSEAKIRKEEEAKKAAETEIAAAFEEAVDAWQHYLDLSKKYGKKEAYMPDSLFKELIKEFFE